ncbi:uncharacterized protein [Palaemon carinicauda]|uniref:uncharacterized protein n=1 Tax=Palaemon carinicauda TaxID=392227 RepID=UPI0035B63A15
MYDRAEANVKSSIDLTERFQGAETLAIKKTEEKKLGVAETRMLRWMCVVTRRAKIRNEVIRGTTGVRKLSDKIQESRLRWYGHAMRRDEHYIGRRVMEMEVQGARRRGRPKRRWMDCIKDDLRSKGLTSDEVWNRGKKAPNVRDKALQNIGQNVRNARDKTLQNNVKKPPNARG